MTETAAAGGPTTADRILDAAEALVQTRGFNGFSYAHVAGQLGITTAGLHYHYGGKAALGEALIERYSGRFLDALADVEASGGSPRARLERYSDLYEQVLRSGRMCLCGILAAEYQTLPDPMRDSIVRFFDANLTWLSSVLERGRADGALAFAGEPRDAAQALLAGLEGAMLLARPYGDPERFDAAARRMLDALEA